MKAFNKLFSLVVASVLVFSLAGCGDKEESKKFSANLNGTEIAITYVSKVWSESDALDKVVSTK